MADAALDILRQDALMKRLKNIGGNHVMWSAKDAALISDHIMSMPAQILRDAPKPLRKLVDTGAAAVARRKLSEQGIVIRAAQPNDRSFLFVISSEDTDLAGDVVTVAGINRDNYQKNPVVLNAHDSSTLPIAASTSPVVSGKTLTAIAKFPEPGVSEASDQVASAIRGKLVRGASIGFIPLRWSFTKDSSRPFGVDFHEIRLLEWSVCGIPCNPSCLLLGTVESRSAPRRRNAPVDDPFDDAFEDESTSDWQCQGSDALPLDISDDLYDAAEAKSALLEKCSSPDGTILDEAADHFLAFDASAPLVAKSYLFPFSRVTDSGIVASKIGWRQSMAALENSKIAGLPVTDARMLVDRLEARLGDVKMAGRRREARALAASISKREGRASAPFTDPVQTRDQRMAEARRFRYAAMTAAK